MTKFRFIPLALALTAASTLIACNTVPTMPMSTAAAGAMGTPDQMAKMDAQMQAMRAMHEKMMAAKTPEERNKMMAEHMKTMQDSMQMMKGMGGGGMGDMKGMPGMTAEMAAHHQMMAKRMEMMETMMPMMMDRMPASK
jgi:N-methylhydantoinase B/oxoprolinase/acetone carboxylase alpha subunit